jgi:hypothetical protein
VRGRLAAHLAKLIVADYRQGTILRAAGPLRSWVLNAVWARHQPLELEIDLIAGHVQTTGVAPAAQFTAEAAQRKAGGTCDTARVFVAPAPRRSRHC